MPTRGLYHLPTALAWGLTALLAVVVSPDVGRAECGDYVVIKGSKSTPVATDAPAPISPKPAAPCHGPSCQHKDGPVTPLAPVPPPSAGPTDAILTAIGVADQWTIGGVVPLPSPRPVRAGAAVFHPPRHA
jgi:hypothetical protein